MRCGRHLQFPGRLAFGSILALTALSAASSCAGGSDKTTQPAAHASATNPILQFAEVADPGEEGSATENGDLRLGALKTFELKTVDVGSDSLGRPALKFEIVDSQQDEFHRWTGSLVGRRLAVLVDGKVLTAPTVRSALPGGGIVESGATPWTMEKVRALVDRIRSQIGAAKS
jgi:preprotein translocase subunit SecD